MKNKRIVKYQNFEDVSYVLQNHNDSIFELKRKIDVLFRKFKIKLKEYTYYSKEYGKEYNIFAYDKLDAKHILMTYLIYVENLLKIKLGR